MRSQIAFTTGNCAKTVSTLSVQVVFGPLLRCPPGLGVSQICTHQVTAVTAPKRYSRYAHLMSEYTLIPNVMAEIQIPEKGILSHTIYNSDAVKTILFGFAPGQELTAHTAPMPAQIQVLEGEAEITLGGDAMPIKPGAFIHMEANLTHGIRALTPFRMLLTLVKSGRAQ